MLELETLQHQCQSVVAALQHQLGSNLIALVLFGSRARGDAHTGSDWDLLLVAKALPAKTFERHLYLKRMLPDDWRGWVSVLAKTLDELETFESDLFLDIALDGVILADTDGYIERRLVALRQRMQQQGLYRDRQGQDFIWRWQHQSSDNWEFIWKSLP